MTWGEGKSYEQQKAELTDKVSETVGYQVAGALLGAGVVYAISKTTPLRPPWWLGVALGAAIGASGQWGKENR